MATGVCAHCGASFVYNPANSKGKFCSYDHYWASGRPGRPLAQRFNEKVARGDGCWLWTGGRNNQGYGMLGGKLAHRIAFELVNGPIPDRLFVCHRCDVPLCCRPDHLFLGDGYDNMRDASAKKRTRNDKKTHCPQGHEYTAENTYTSGQNGRRCKTCHLSRALARRSRQRAAFTE